MATEISGLICFLDIYARLICKQRVFVARLICFGVQFFEFLKIALSKHYLSIR